jgi:hypothetical protein
MPFKLIYKEYDNNHFQREYGGVLASSSSETVYNYGMSVGRSDKDFIEDGDL